MTLKHVRDIRFDGTVHNNNYDWLKACSPVPSLPSHQQTIAQPSNATLPLSESHFEALSSYGNYSVIWFSVPNGTYSYSILPQAFPQHSGSVTVNGMDTTIEVQAATILCTETTGSTG